MTIVYHPIGTIYSPFKSKEGMPIQASGAKGVKGHIILREEYRQGLADLEGFSHIILIYHFHRSAGFDLLTMPFLDDKPRGVFATRAPGRPNAIGLSVVRLLDINGNHLQVENIDILDETPLLDIKPYISGFDIHPAEKSGWLKNKTNNLSNTKSDNRFD